MDGPHHRPSSYIFLRQLAADKLISGVDNRFYKIGNFFSKKIIDLNNKEHVEKIIRAVFLYKENIVFFDSGFQSDTGVNQCLDFFTTKEHNVYPVELGDWKLDPKFYDEERPYGMTRREYEETSFFFNNYSSRRLR